MILAPSAIDTVLFDYGLVLSGPPNAGAWAEIRAIAGLDEENLHTAYWAHRNAYDRGALTGTAYWHAVASNGSVTMTSTQVEALIAADTRLWGDLNAPLVDWARRLQRRGVRTGILSNIGDSISEGLTSLHPFIAGFDHVTWSHTLRLAKPDPAIYRASAAALGTTLERILFIDDREDNIAAADALGMTGIRYTTYPAFEAEMRARKLDALLDIGQAEP